MAELPTRLPGNAGEARGRNLSMGERNEALAKVCTAVGISKLTHHDLRHLLVTHCIESGVDIPTVARWLGHKEKAEV